MARNTSAPVHTARDLASVTRLPLPTVSKLLKQLLQSGLLASHRGMNGGYSLAKEPADISLAEIITAIEGPIALTECSTDVTGLCDLERSCPIKTNQRVVSEVVRGALQKVMLADLMQPSRLTVIQGLDGKVLPAADHLSGRVQ
jgi:FeS assembly SUF system regulator